MLRKTEEESEDVKILIIINNSHIFLCCHSLENINKKKKCKNFHLQIIPRTSVMSRTYHQTYKSTRN